MRIAFLGGGNMATALIGGLIAKGTDPRSISVIEMSPAARDKLGRAGSGNEIGGRIVGRAHADMAEAVEHALVGKNPVGKDKLGERVFDGLAHAASCQR